MRRRGIPILSGSDDFNLGVCHDVTAGNLSLEGLFMDLRSIGYSGPRGTKNMYVNLDKLDEYKLDSPYDMVRNVTWTLDKVIGMTKSI